MIRIKNQEEFEKCCEICNSKDIESRYLGLSLLEECTEFLNSINVSVLIYNYGYKSSFSWYKFIEIYVQDIEFNFGIVLYNLLYNGFCTLNTITYKLIEDDKSN